MLHVAFSCFHLLPATIFQNRFCNMQHATKARSNFFEENLQIWRFLPNFAHMKPAQIFHQYIWIINTLRAYRKLTLEGAQRCQTPLRPLKTSPNPCNFRKYFLSLHSDSNKTIICVQLHYHTTRTMRLPVVSLLRYWQRVCFPSRPPMMLSLHQRP